MSDITLKIHTPDKTLLEQGVYRVIVPAFNGDMTIIRDRAPTSLLLKDGDVKILDGNNNVSAKYTIKGGVAEIADNICIIAIEEIAKV